jgi:hypothetical protein
MNTSTLHASYGDIRGCLGYSLHVCLYPHASVVPTLQGRVHVVLLVLHLQVDQLRGHAPHGDQFANVWTDPIRGVTCSPYELAASTQSSTIAVRAAAECPGTRRQACLHAITLRTARGRDERRRRERTDECARIAPRGAPRSIRAAAGNQHAAAGAQEPATHIAAVAHAFRVPVDVDRRVATRVERVHGPEGLDAGVQVSTRPDKAWLDRLPVPTTGGAERADVAEEHVRAEHEALARPGPADASRSRYFRKDSGSSGGRTARCAPARSMRSRRRSSPAFSRARCP